ncbi:leucine Rich repeat-containing domain protein [gut metagenome]|uniref:Leucine Rich repeat-containing domain protein n=1 Tax=gut metagenome TaxID=749906 RepID=J9H3T1_9ZZZZ
MKKFFGPMFLCLLALTSVLIGCSDDDEEWQEQAYGYVQFKVLKAASAEKGAQTRGLDILEKLNDAKKIKVVMLYDGNSIIQTLPLNSYNTENAEFGLRSDKLELLAGNYQLIGYYLYDKLDKEIYADAPNNFQMKVIPGGLQVEKLYANAVKRGMVHFKLVKHGLPETRTEAYEAYPFSNIQSIDIYAKNLFTQEDTIIRKVKVKYIENLKDAYAECDTTVWLKAGSYQISAYHTYSDKSGKNTLEIASIPSSKTSSSKTMKRRRLRCPSSWMRRQNI